MAEQVRTNREYAERHGIEIVGQYGDYGKRHQAERRRSFQAMMEDIKTQRPNMVLVQRLDRFGTNGPNELGAFLTTLKKLRAKQIRQLRQLIVLGLLCETCCSVDAKRLWQRCFRNGEGDILP